VKFTGEYTPEKIQISHQKPIPTPIPPTPISLDEEPQPEMRAEYTRGFHATDDQLKGDAYAVFENGWKLTFFRSEDGKDYKGRSFSIPEGQDSYVVEGDLTYYRVDENTPNKSDWPWLDGDGRMDSDITAIDMKGAIRPLSTSNFFFGYTGVSYANRGTNGLALLDTSKVTDMSYMFGLNYELSSLDVASTMDVGNVETMQGMFLRCYSLEKMDISNWNTGKVKNMANMFAHVGEGLSSMRHLNISHIDMSGVTDITGMLHSVNLKYGELVIYGIDTSGIENSSIIRDFDWEMDSGTEIYRVTLSADTKLTEEILSADRLCAKDEPWFNEDTREKLTAEELFLEGGHKGTWLRGTRDDYIYLEVYSNSSFVGMPGLQIFVLKDGYFTFDDASRIPMQKYGYNLVSIRDEKGNVFEVIDNKLTIDYRLIEYGDNTYICAVANYVPKPKYSVELDLGAVSGGVKRVNNLFADEFEEISVYSSQYFGYKILGAKDINDPDKVFRHDGYYIEIPANSYEDGDTAELILLAEKLPTYRISFDANGGTGSVPSKRLLTSEEKEFFICIYKLGHELVSMKDQYGKEWPVEDYYVTIPANYYQDGDDIVLSAQWEKVSQEVQVVNGEVTFTLKEGEQLLFYEIPASVTYEIWEEVPEGWILLSTSGDTGVIQPLENSEAGFTNKWDPDAVQLRSYAYKRIDGEIPGDREFLFLFTTDGDYYGESAFSDVNSFDGRILILDAILDEVFLEEMEGMGVEFPLTETLFFREWIPDPEDEWYGECFDQFYDPTIIYDESEYRIELTVDLIKVDGVDKLTASYVYKDAEGNELSEPPVFNNTTKPGSLKIEKAIEGATSKVAEQEFTVNVAFTDKNRDAWNGKVKVDGVETETENGAITLEIVGGEDNAITVSEIPDGVRYEVKETGSYPGWTMDETVHTGMIESTKTDDVKFTNTYSAKGTAVIEAEKNLIGRTPKDGEFTFTLTDANDTVVGTATNAYVQVQTAEGYVYKHIAAFPEITYTAEGEYTYEIKETVGEDETVEYAVAPLTVKVKVEDTEGRGRLTATVTYVGGSNVITNKVKTGALSLTKKVENAKEMHVDKAFAFTVYLADNQGQPLSGEYILNDTDVIAFTGGAGSLTLKDGETAVISGLPHGANYSIVEDAEDGFRQSCTGETGTIAIDETAKAVFTNTYSAEGEYRFEGVKVLQNAELEAGQFTFELIGSDGLPVESVTNDAEGNFAFAVLHFDDSDAGEKTYTVCEIAGSLPGITYDKTTYEVTLTITDNGDGTLSITAEGAEDGIVFTNRYDERDDETIPVSFTVTKEWQGGGGGAIQLTLYADGEKMDPQPAYERDGDRYTYNNLQKYKNGRTIVYSAKERYVDGFIAIYDNVAPYEGESRMIYNGGTIINRKEKVPSFTVTKVWQGLGKEKAPKIELILYCNGVETDVKTPTPNSRGEYRYYDLPETVNGEPAVYTVKEKPLAGYTVKYELANGTESDHADNGGRIINTRIPATGDGFTPMMWLMLMALSLLMLTGIRKRQMK